MNIDELTLKQIKEISSLISGSQAMTHSFSIGEKYLIRTVTMMYTGRLIVITDSDLVLEQAAWIADSGLYSDALAKGTLGEVEPYPNEVLVSRAAIVDAATWNFDLPRDQK